MNTTEEQSDAVGASLPFVSVVIPVLNDPVRLRRCLQALHEQTYPQACYEVIVVDNGPDEAVQETIAAFPGVRGVVETRRGLHAARNAGIAAAQGELLGFTDADCLPASDWVEKGAGALAGDQRVGLVGGRIQVFARDPARMTLAEVYDCAMAFPQRRYIEQAHFGATANVFTRRSVLERVGTFDGRLISGGDAEWGRRVHAAGYRLLYHDDVIVAHPARESVYKLFQKSVRIAQGEYQMGRKNRGWLLRSMAKDFLRPFQHRRRVFANPKLHGMGQKWRIFTLYVLLQHARVFEKTRLLLGGRVGSSEWEAQAS
jgi:glycosyltransferase involved in cell wall biosynthesis